MLKFKLYALNAIYEPILLQLNCRLCIVPSCKKNQNDGRDGGKDGNLKLLLTITQAFMN